MDYASERSAEIHESLVRRIQDIKEPRVYPLYVCNVVTTVRLFPDSAPPDSSLNLIAIACQLRGRLGYWVPKSSTPSSKTTTHAAGVDQSFPSCVSRCRETATTNSIFASGAVVMAGARDESVSLLSAHLLVWRLQKDLGLHNIGVYDFTVCNVVSSFGLGYRLNLPRIYKECQLYNTWKPEKFRGMKWEHCGVSFVLFRTGMAVLTGAKTFEALKVAYESAKIILKDYELKDDQEDQIPDGLRVDRAKVERVRYPIAERKEELRIESFKKQEAYYIQTLRSKYEPAGASNNTKKTTTTATSKKKNPAKSKPSTVIQPVIPTTVEPVKSFRWNTIDSMATIARMAQPIQANVMTTPSSTMMIEMPPEWKESIWLSSSRRNIPPPPNTSAGAAKPISQPSARKPSTTTPPPVSLR